MSSIDLSQISDKQYQFLTASKKHVGFGGARGGGKSWSVRTKAKILAVTYEGIKILIVRRTFPELVNNHINQLLEELAGIARYNKTEKVFAFPNGSSIKFGYCNNDKDLLQYQGAEFDVVFLDEATQLQEMWIKKIIACVRGVNDFPKRIYYTCNPGGASHSYFKRLFIDRKYEEGETPEDYAFIQALVTDNKALMASQPDYIKQLEALPPKLREAWLHGRWDVYEGQFFEDFADRPEYYRERTYTHVIDPFEIPDSWKIYRSFFTMDTYLDAVMENDREDADIIKTDMIQTAVANGDSQEEAEKDFSSSFVTKCGKAYQDGELTSREAVTLLEKYGDLDREEADEKVQYWVFKEEYPAYDDMSQSAVTKYYGIAEPAGIGIETYYSFLTEASKCTGEQDADGKTISGSVKAEKLELIDALPLTRKQKDALYLAEGWAESKLYEAPWH